MGGSGDLFGSGGAPARRAAAASAKTASARVARAPPQASVDDGNYDAASIEVLEGLEPVRRRPGMYIGGTDEKALHHLFAEVIDNSMDEAVAGHATFIEVELEEGGWLTVTDNGRGIPVDPHPKFPKKSALEVIMTTLHAGGKFNSKVYETVGRPARRRRLRRQRPVGDAWRSRSRAGRQLYRQVFSRGVADGTARDGRPRAQPARHQGALQAGPADLRQGQPSFQPRRLFKMARSKAYLFGGVEIRWRCAPALLAGSDSVPAEATLPISRTG